MPTARHETLDEKAQRLLENDQVRIVFHNHLCVVGLVVGDHSEYDTVLYPSGLFCCSCKWGHYHSITRYPCSHAIALRALHERIPA